MSRRNQRSYLRDAKVRRGNLNDCKEVEGLLNFQVRQLFGTADVKETISKCFLTLVLEDNDSIVGAISFSNSPNVPSLAKWAWRHWIKKLYSLETTNPWNTLFVHFLAWHRKYTFCFVDTLLQHLFIDYYHLEYVILIAPPGVIEIEWLEGIATRILPNGCTDPYKVQTLYLMVRQHFIPKYTIRKAVEEDNDDLVPLIHTHCERLKEVYGEYYISEILTRHQDSGRQIIVAEHSNTVVAVLCLNSMVDFQTLNEQFELLPYYGLRKPHENDLVEHSKTVHQSVAQEEDDDDEENYLTSSIAPPASNWKSRSTDSSIVRDGSDSSSDKDLTIHSEDEFTIVNVSSLHLGIDEPVYRYQHSDDDRSESLNSSDSTLSIMVLSGVDDDIQKQQSNKQRQADNISEAFDSESVKMYQSYQQRALSKTPTFHGEPNAFVVEIAAAIPEHENGALIQLLEASFGCFPDRDYCIIGIPSTTPPFSLLRYFVRATPRPVCMFKQELYVLHRNTISSSLEVREAVSSDLSNVEKLVSTIPKQEMFLYNFKMAISGHTEGNDAFIAAYVMLNRGSPVGVAVLKEEDDVEYLKTHYELNNWFDELHHKAGSHGLIEHLILTPIFQKHSCFFLSELHRISDFTVLYYKVSPNDSVNSKRERSLAAVLGDLLFVKPKIKPEFNRLNVEGCEPHAVVHREDPPFTLYCSTVDTCSLPRIEINAKIVVIGSSQTALAFLETLLYGYNRNNTHVTFTNVTLVAPHVLNHQKQPNRIRDMMFVITSNLSYRYLQMHQTRTYLNLINAVLTEIDRKNKRIILNGAQELCYDFLFLMCGEQFQKPKTGKRLSEYPSNVFIINTETDASHSLNYLKVLMSKTWRHCVVVYGNNLRAYCCMTSLLEYGVPASHLIYVEPFPPEVDSIPPHAVSHFNDSDVDAKVQSTLQELGITVYSGYYFLEWAYNKDEKIITSVKFESKHKMIDLECLALFLFAERSISTKTFLAINRAGLVFDGNLVIDPDCRTNDSYIYAAGTITKYSRKYYADHKSHKYYNAYEIGTKLGIAIRKMLLSSCRDSADSEDKHRVTPLISYGRTKGDMLVPTYTDPICNYCVLPGKLYYLSVRKPGPQVPLESSMGSDSYGQVLVTGDCNTLHEKGYFRLHLNEYKQVETITCLSLEPIDRVNLTSLYGKHQSLLNNVADRFNMLLITDFYEFFRQPWTCAIYHDRFSTFQEQTIKFLESITEVEGESLIEDIFKMLKNNGLNKLTQPQMEELEDKFEGSFYQKALVEMVLDYIKTNLNFLPMYAHPFIVNLILQDYQSSPCFTEL